MSGRKTDRSSLSQNGNSKPGLLLFWDYDTQWGADRSRSAGGPKKWGPREFENTERLLELHAEYNVPACFAVVGAAALPGKRPYHDQDQIRRIHAAGHEVGSHAFRHDWLPGLNRQQLLDTLRQSKDAIEQCIGASICAFVPPYNQPWDYPRGNSFSLSERREAKDQRSDLGQVCEALYETGYRFCRVSYRPMQQRLAERIMRRRLDRPSRLEKIAGVTCVRLNTPGGFDAPAVKMLESCVMNGGTAVVYGHPHSLMADGPQHESHLVTFLKRVSELREQSGLQVRLPARVVSELS